MDPSEEKIVILRDIPDENTLLKQEIVYLLSTEWWKQWLYYTENSFPGIPHPGEIDNSSLLDGKCLRRDLNTEQYIILDIKNWNRLLNWYQGGPEIEIHVQDSLLLFDTTEVELTSYTNWIHQKDIWKILYIPKTMTIGQLKNYACQKLMLNPYLTTFQEIHDWNQTRSLENFEDYLLEEAGISNGGRILLEETEKEAVDDDEEFRRAMDESLKEHYEKGGEKEIGGTVEVPFEQEEIEMDTFEIFPPSIVKVREDREEIGERIRESMMTPKCKTHLKALNKTCAALQDIFKSLS